MNDSQNIIKKKTSAKWSFIAATILAIATTGVIIYYQNSKFTKELADKSNRITELEAKIKNLEKSQTQASNSGEINKPICIAPNSNAVENIIASITSKNTAALEGHLATPVSVILSASEGIGNRTPSQAVSDISGFISNAHDWDFSLPQSMIDSYRNGFYANYFPENSIIGRSDNNKVISLSFNCAGKISTVFLSPSSDLLLN